MRSSGLTPGGDQAARHRQRVVAQLGEGIGADQRAARIVEVQARARPARHNPALRPAWRSRRSGAAARRRSASGSSPAGRSPSPRRSSCPSSCVFAPMLRAARRARPHPCHRQTPLPIARVQNPLPVWHNHGGMTRVPRRPVPPLDRAALERLALRYVERFATTRGRLTDYLKRKIRERGWDGDAGRPGGARRADGRARLCRRSRLWRGQGGRDGAARAGRAAGGRGAAPGGHRRARMPRRSRRRSPSARSTRRSPSPGGGGSGRSPTRGADRAAAREADRRDAPRGTFARRWRGGSSAWRRATIAELIWSKTGPKRSR